MQGMASGRIGDLAEARAIVRQSFDLAHYDPDPRAAQGWEDAAGRLADAGPA